MARVVCQVLPRSERLTLLWSEAGATFPPYCLEAAAQAELHRLAGQAHEQLGRLVAVGGDLPAAAEAGYQLAQTGHALYRLLFQVEEPSGAPGQQVRAWLDRIAREGGVERLEIVGDAFLLPWHVVYDQQPDRAAFDQATLEAPCWQGFWGRRFPLLGGRRVQWLRGRNLPEKPALVLAIDPGVLAALPEEERQRLTDFQARHDLVVADSPARLADIFQSQEVDLLYVFGPANGDAVQLNGARLTAQELESIVFSGAEGEGPSDQTVVFLNACPGGPAGNLLAAFERFSAVGLLGTVQPLTAPLANRCGLEFLTAFLDGGQTVAEAMATLLKKCPVAGALYFACCLGDVHVGGPPEGSDGPEPMSLPDRPYQPLVPLQEESAALMVGREFDTAQLAGLVDEGDARLVLVHGMPGVGKGSLLHAGVIPYLEDRSIGYKFLRERGEGDAEDDERDYPVMAIRASSDLIGQLALALLEFCGRPYSYVTPAGQTVTVDLPSILRGAVGDAQDQAGPLPTTDELRRALCHHPDLLAEVLEAITAQLPFELVLLIEHGEELFSLIPSDVEPRKAQEALAILRNALLGHARAKFIVSLRTEYVGRFLDQLTYTPEDSRSIRTFLVRELSEEELVEIILQPTSTEALPGTDEAPQQKYGFQFEQDLPEQIAHDAIRLGGANQESPVALVHAVCSRLFQLASRQTDKAVRAGHLKAVGGVEKGLSKYVAGLVNATSSRQDRKAMNGLLQKLFQRQPDGSVTRALVFEDELNSQWTGTSPLEEVLTTTTAPDNHLLDVNYLNIGGTEGNFVSLGHDAIAPVIAQQTEEARKRSYGWGRMIDGLWITVPLLILLGVFAWTSFRRVRNELSLANESLTSANEFRELNEPKLAGVHWPAYVGQLHAADQAMQTGDMVRARQALISLKPTLKEGMDDQRGFEWYYLWQQMHQDYATLYGHVGTVNAVDLTPDGLTLATASADGTVRLWDPVAGRELARLPLKDKSSLAAGRCVALSADGTVLAAGGDDGLIRVWNVARAGIAFPAGAASLAASLLPGGASPFSSLGQLAVQDTVVLRAEIADQKGPVLTLAFSPDGKNLASAGKDGTVRLWDMTAPSPVASATLKEHTGPVLAVAYSPDGKQLASAGTDKKAILWDVAKGTKIRVLEGHPQEITAVAWSPDGKTLATGGGKTAHQLEIGVVKLWNTATGKERKTPSFATAPIFALAFVDKGTTLVTAAKNNIVQFWNAATGQERFALRGHLGWVCSLATARGGSMIASSSYDGTTKVWLPRAQASRDLLKASSQPTCAVVFSPDDRWLATGSGDGVVKLWDAAAATEVKAMQAHQGAVLALAWAPDGKRLVSGGEDGQLKLWDVDLASKTFGNELDATAGHAKAVTCLDWPAKGDRFASGGLDGNGKVWKVEGGKFDNDPRVISTPSPVWCLLFDERIDLLATGHEDAKARLWNSDTGKPLAVPEPEFAGHTGGITGITMVLQFVENEHIRLWPITASADQSLKVWNIKSGIDRNTLRGHGGPVTCMALGRRFDHTLVTGSTDGTIVLWDPQDEQERWMLQPKVGAIRAVALSSDSRWLAAAGEDGSVRLYRGGKEELKSR